MYALRLSFNQPSDERRCTAFWCWDRRLQKGPLHHDPRALPRAYLYIHSQSRTHMKKAVIAIVETDAQAQSIVNELGGGRVSLL